MPVNPAKVAVSSTFSPRQDPQNLINGCGLTGSRHDRDSGASTMWHTLENPGAPAAPATTLPPNGCATLIF